MKWQMLMQQIRLEMKLFLREKRTVLWTFLFPVFLILTFGLLLTEPDLLRFDIQVVDEDHSPQSQQIVGALAALPVVNVEPAGRDEALIKLRAGEGSVVIVFASGFGAAATVDSAIVELYYDPAQEPVRELVSSLLRQVIDEQNWALIKRSKPINIHETAATLFQERLRFMDFLVPGLIGFSLMFTCLYSIGIVVVSYREKGNLRRFAVTPLPKSIFIWGQILNRYMIVLMQAVLIIGLAMLLFEVRIVGRVFDFFVALTIGMITFIALGYAVASIAKTPESASGIANLLFIPMTMLSGVYFPADSLPGFLQPFVKILPLTHLVNAIREIFNRGASLPDVSTELLILGLWIVACLLFSINRFKWE